MGGPLPGKSTSVTGISFSDSALVPIESEEVAALIDDWYESFSELRYGLSQIMDAPGLFTKLPSLSTNAVCVLGLTFVISVFPSKNDCLICASLLGLNCTLVPIPWELAPSRVTVAGSFVVLNKDVDVWVIISLLVARDPDKSVYVKVKVSNKVLILA